MATDSTSSILRRGLRIAERFKASPTFPNPEASAAEPIESMKGYTCWRAIGLANQQFGTLKEDINDHLDKCGDPAAKRVGWSLYMVGIDKSNSKPTVTFYSSDPKSRDMVRSSVKKSGILARYPGFRTMSAKNPIGIGKPEPFTRLEQDLPLQKEASSVTIRLNDEGLVGSELRLGNGSSSTIGGVLESNGKYYWTTAAHTFDESIGALFSDLGEEGENEYDIDETDSEESDAASDLASLELTSRGSLTPEPTSSKDSMQSSLSSSDSDDPEAPALVSSHGSIEGDTASSLPKREYTVFRPGSSPANGLDPSFDIALHEITDSDLRRTSYDKKGMISSTVGEIRGKERGVDVRVLKKRDRTLRAHLSVTPTLITSSTGHGTQELWTISCDDTIEKGDSGSWVVGIDDRAVYGHVVAGSCTSNLAYIVPMNQVLKGLGQNSGQAWRIHASAGISQATTTDHIIIQEDKEDESLKRKSELQSARDNSRNKWTNIDNHPSVDVGDSDLYLQTEIKNLFSRSGICRQGLKSHNLKEIHDYISAEALRAHFGQARHLDDLLQAALPQEHISQREIEEIRSNYLKVFSILIWCGAGQQIRHFTKHHELFDKALPFDENVFTRIARKEHKFYSIEAEIASKGFYDAQWTFCPLTLSKEMPSSVTSQAILPIKALQTLSEGSYSRVSKIALDEEYNNMSHGPRRDASVQHANSNLFVLKTYHSAHSQEYFKNEIAAFCALKKSDHIVHYYCSFVQGTARNIILEHADQGSLESYMQMHEPPTSNEAKSQLWHELLELSKGLQSIHETLTGWHSDIKPANILVFSDLESNHGCHFKITDFGLSHFRKRLDGSVENPTLEKSMFSHVIHGTQTYGAPETVASNLEHTVHKWPDRCDIWSLGCVFSEVATWNILRRDGLEYYRRHRRKEMKRPDLQGYDCFHDGEKVLYAVTSNHEAMIRLARTEQDYITQRVVEVLVADMLHISAQMRPSASMLRYRIHWIMTNSLDNAGSNQKLARKSKFKENFHGKGLPTLSSIGVENWPVQYGSYEAYPNPKRWDWDGIESYRLDGKTIDKFLTGIFGRYKFDIQLQEDRFRFWVPRYLTETERQDLLFKRLGSFEK